MFIVNSRNTLRDFLKDINGLNSNSEVNCFTVVPECWRFHTSLYKLNVSRGSLSRIVFVQVTVNVLDLLLFI